MTGYCITWNGEGDATAGTRQAATDIEFHTDIDEEGVELVSISPNSRCMCFAACNTYLDRYCLRWQCSIEGTKLHCAEGLPCMRVLA